MEYSGKVYEALERMENNRQEMQKHFARLGEILYKNHPDNYPEEFSGIYTEIRKIEADNRKLESLIEYEMEIKTCPNCGEKIPLEAVFCPYCRAEMVEAKIVNQAERPRGARTCKSCGYVNKNGGRFCINCGKPLE